MASDDTNASIRAAGVDLKSALDAFDTEPNDGHRRAIVEAAEQVLVFARDPSYKWMEDALEMSRLSATHLFQVWGGFGEIPEEGSVSFADLAQKLNAETSLIERVVGVLTSQDVLLAVPPDRIAHTARSRILVPSRDSSVLYQVMWDNTMTPFFYLDQYFQKYGRKEPEAMNHIPATFARGCPELSFFQYLPSDPAYFHRFTVGMDLIEKNTPASGIYDFSWLVDKAKVEASREPEPGRAVFVDVGGGRGQAIVAIHNEFPDLPIERFVLQDRQETVDAVVAGGHPLLQKVQKMGIDFHQEQPVKGAMVYFIRRCLHNYSDTLCTRILSILAEAMAPDSKILIQEDIRPVPPNAKTAFLDFLMMTYGGKERSLQCWEEVVGNAGLVISGISQGSGSWQSLAVIECAKKT